MGGGGGGGRDLNRAALEQLRVSGLGFILVVERETFNLLGVAESP